MKELDDHSVDLIVTSPPYFNAPFDYPNLFKTYGDFTSLVRNTTRELRRVLEEGRIVTMIVDDTLINGEKFPIVADVTKIFLEEGFRYRDRILWIKPEGYIRKSKRSGVLLQHPYPMYFYPDNVAETILIFQNGNFDYSGVSKLEKTKSRIDIDRYHKEKWYLGVWNITNVLPNASRLEKGIAAFPEEIPARLITLFSYKGETVLDPFMGSGTTLKIARQLDRKCVGYEIDKKLLRIVKKKLGLDKKHLFHRSSDFDIIVRDDSKYMRSKCHKTLKKN